MGAGSDQATLVDDVGRPFQTVLSPDGVHVQLVTSAGGPAPGSPSLGTTVLANTEETAELAATDIFAADAVVPARDGILLIEISSSVAVRVQLKIVRNAVTIVKDLNAGAAIGVNQWFSFEFPVRASDTANLRVGLAATVTALLAFEDKT